MNLVFLPSRNTFGVSIEFPKPEANPLSMDMGNRFASGFGNSMETPKVVREGKKTRFMHIWDKV